MNSKQFNGVSENQEEESICNFSQPTRLYRCTRVASNLVKTIMTKCVSCLKTVWKIRLDLLRPTSSSAMQQSHSHITKPVCLVRHQHIGTK